MAYVKPLSRIETRTVPTLRLATLSGNQMVAIVAVDLDKNPGVLTKDERKTVERPGKKAEVLQVEVNGGRILDIATGFLSLSRRDIEDITEEIQNLKEARILELKTAQEQEAQQGASGSHPPVEAQAT
jgi:hypothetical protein